MNNSIDNQEHKGLPNKTILKVAITRIVSLTFDLPYQNFLIIRHSQCPPVTFNRVMVQQK
ncbi:hypothetical protein CXF95_18760 [Paraglaciecola sp. MB-3u-78]|nr:hypothetical protein CXF95_18760 [Paraglaciecola sp. MB-3u-78]